MQAAPAQGSHHMIRCCPLPSRPPLPAAGVRGMALRGARGPARLLRGRQVARPRQPAHRCVASAKVAVRSSGPCSALRTQLCNAAEGSKRPLEAARCPLRPSTACLACRTCRHYGPGARCGRAGVVCRPHADRWQHGPAAPHQGGLAVPASRGGQSLVLHWSAGADGAQITAPASSYGKLWRPHPCLAHRPSVLCLLPQVYGALLSMGDGHGAMGSGEIAGTGVETSLNARVRCATLPPCCHSAPMRAQPAWRPSKAQAPLTSACRRVTLHKADSLPKPLKVRGGWRNARRGCSWLQPSAVSVHTASQLHSSALLFLQGLSGPLLENKDEWVVQGFSFSDYLRDLEVSLQTRHAGFQGRAAASALPPPTLLSGPICCAGPAGHGGQGVDAGSGVPGGIQ